MDSITERIERSYSEERKKHTYGVLATATELAGLYGADPGKIRTAALFHDLFRGIPTKALDVYVRQLGLPAKYLGNPNLAHSKLAAIVMERDYGIDDPEILDAVRYHTTGRAGMGLIEKILFLADAIEPGRSYPGVESLRELARLDLNKACLTALERTIDYVGTKSEYLDPDTLLARDWLIKEEKQHG